MFSSSHHFGGPEHNFASYSGFGFDSSAQRTSTLAKNTAAFSSSPTSSDSLSSTSTKVKKESTSSKKAAATKKSPKKSTAASNKKNAPIEIKTEPSIASDTKLLLKAYDLNRRQETTTKGSKTLKKNSQSSSSSSDLVNSSKSDVLGGGMVGLDTTGLSLTSDDMTSKNGVENDTIKTPGGGKRKNTAAGSATKTSDGGKNDLVKTSGKSTGGKKTGETNGNGKKTTTTTANAKGKKSPQKSGAAMSQINGLNGIGLGSSNNGLIESSLLANGLNSAK